MIRPALGLVGAALVAVPPAAAAPPERLEPSRLAGFVDLYMPKARGKDFELRLASYRGDAIHNAYIVRRQGDWTRVERKENGRTGVQQIHLPTGVVVERTDAVSGAAEVFSIRAPDRAPTPNIDYASRPTKRSWKAAGQKCRIWEVYRGVEAGYTTFTRLGCITRDGIEVARWTTGRTGAELGERVTGYYLYRGPVKDVEIRPAAASLDVSRWFPEPVAATSDEVVLKTEDSTQALTLRRRGPRLYSETVNADASRNIFVDGGDGATVSARVAATGAPESYIARRGQAPVALPVVRIDQPAETVLGLVCAWYDAMPYVADATRHECRTDDGLVLIVRMSAEGRQTTYRAVSVSRRPLSNADLMPPAWLLDLARWGAGG